MRGTKANPSGWLAPAAHRLKSRLLFKRIRGREQHIEAND
jgi:hypothetical protein